VEALENRYQDISVGRVTHHSLCCRM